MNEREVVNMMENEKKAQMIIVNKSAADDGIQIIMPPFRAIHLFELEDNFDEIVVEIKESVFDQALSKHMIEFFSAFREGMMSGDPLPIIEYFMNHDPSNRNPQDMMKIFDSLKDFIENANDEDRLMH